MTAEAAAPSAANAVGERRRRRARRLAVRLAVGVGLPTLLAAIYAGLVATPRYQSVSSFTIQSADGAVGASSFAFLLASVPGAVSARDVLLVRDYILSRDMLAILDRDDAWRRHYAAGNVDFGSRLAADASSEDRFRYYTSRINLQHDSASGVLTLTLQAFTAADAERFSRAILRASEEMVNRMSEKARQDRIHLATREVELNEARLTKARAKILELQQRGADLNPLQSASAVMTIRTELEGALAQARAELGALLLRLQPTAPEVAAQRAKIASIQSQIDRQSRRLVGEESGSLNASIAEFEPAVHEKELAERGYTSALASLELARVDADRQHRYLATISQPSRPSEPTHPSLPWTVLTVFALSFVALTIGSLLLAALREHAEV